jgi:hypothetical protein
MSWSNHIKKILEVKARSSLRKVTCWATLSIPLTLPLTADFLLSAYPEVESTRIAYDRPYAWP